MAEKMIYTNRRELLKVASVSGLALMGSKPLASAAAEVRDAESESCGDDSRPTHPSQIDNDELELAKKELWSAFYEGVKSWNGKSAEQVTFEPGVEEDRERIHAAILKRKWRLWNKCADETKHCAYFAGLLIEGIRMYEHPGHESAYTSRQFDTAVAMVQKYQQDRFGAKFIGIVC